MKKVLFLFFLFLLLSSLAHAQMNLVFTCEGGESGMVLSHAKGDVSLQNGYCGEGELFNVIIKYVNGRKCVALECCGGESGKYLSHASGRIFLQNGYNGEGELWTIHEKGNRLVIVARGGESGYYLSHANGYVQLIPAYRGEGELWYLDFPK